MFMRMGMMAGGVCLTVLLSSCQYFEPEKKTETPTEPLPAEYSILTETKNGDAKLLNADVEVHIAPKAPPPANDDIVIPADYALPALPPASADANVSGAGTESSPVGDKLYRQLFPADGEPAPIKVAINFDAANLADVIPAFATPLGINYILDVETAGSVTMSVNDTLSHREVWKIFDQVLTLSGAYCELDGKVLHIRPAAKIVREPQLLRDDSNIMARVVPLKFVGAQSIVAQVARLLPSENAVIALEKQNALLVIEVKAHLDRLLQLIAQLDRPPRQGWAQIVLPCVNVPGSQLKEELLNVLPVLGFPAVDGAHENSDAGAIVITDLDRVQFLIAAAPNREALQELKRWVQLLDRPENSELERVYIYEVVNGHADELLQALSVIFPTESATLSVAGNDGSTKTSTQSGKGASPAATTAPAGNTAKKNTPVHTPQGSASTLFDTPVRVFADAVHNRLLLRTTPRAYGMIDAILKRLDTIPTQILLQVLVLEIELSDSNEFGVEFSAKASGGDSASIFDTNFEALQPSTPPGQTGGKFYIYNPDNPEEKFGYIRAIAGKTSLKVLSSPQILATSHSEAKISVGKRVPIVTSDITDTSSAVSNDDTALLRSYQYEDTGIILTVTPQATRGGLISMKINQIISDAVDNTTRGIDSPIIKEDELSTTLALRSGRTLVMGGLIKEKSNETLSSVPGIANIPLLRNFFGNTVQMSERTEILVLVTATIITEDSELQSMVRRYHQAVEEIRKFERRQFDAVTGVKKESTDQK